MTDFLNEKHSRQELLLGQQGQSKILESVILVVGSNTCAVEFAKNVLLAGCAKVYITCESSEETTSDADLKRQFYLKERNCSKMPDIVLFLSQFGKVEQKTLDFQALDQAYNFIGCFSNSLNTVTRWSIIASKAEVPFVGVICYCFFGLVVTDLQKHNHVVRQRIHNESHLILIQNISVSNETVASTSPTTKVTISGICPELTLYHATNETITFSIISTQIKLSGKIIEKKEFDSKLQITLEVECDTNSLGSLTAEPKNGFITFIPDLVKHHSKPIQETLENSNDIILEFAKALEKFREQNHGSFPTRHNIVEMGLLCKSKDENKLNQMLHVYDCSLYPVAAFFGGYSAAIVMRFFSRQVKPAIDLFTFDFLPKNYEIFDGDHQNNDLIRIFGLETVNRIKKSKFLIVGAGALGCELLKNLVACGFGTNDMQMEQQLQGSIIVYDKDAIAISNVSRQLLFSEAHIHKFKSVVAAEVIKKWNTRSSVNIISQVAFFEDQTVHSKPLDYKTLHTLNGIFSAVDGIDARLFIEKICFMHGIPMYDGGIDGWSGSQKVVIPFHTAPYSTSSSSVTRNVGACTLKERVTKIGDIVQNAQAKYVQWFSFLITENSTATTTTTANNSSRNLSSEELRMKELRDALLKKKWGPGNTQKLLEILFVLEIESILAAHPADSKDDLGLPFWSGGYTPVPLNIEREEEYIARFQCAITEYLKLPDNQRREFDKDAIIHVKLLELIAEGYSKCYNFKRPSAQEVRVYAGKMQANIITSAAQVSAIMALSAIIDLYQKEKQIKNWYRYQLENVHIVRIPVPPPNPRERFIHVPTNDFKITPNTSFNHLSKKIQSLFPDKNSYEINIKLGLQFSVNLKWDRDEDITDDNSVLKTIPWNEDWKIMLVELEMQSNNNNTLKLSSAFLYFSVSMGDPM